MHPSFTIPFFIPAISWPWDCSQSSSLGVLMWWLCALRQLLSSRRLDADLPTFVGNWYHAGIAVGLYYLVSCWRMKWQNKARKVPNAAAEIPRTAPYFDLEQLPSLNGSGSLSHNEGRCKESNLPRNFSTTMNGSSNLGLCNTVDRFNFHFTFHSRR